MKRKKIGVSLAGILLLIALVCKLYVDDAYVADAAAHAAMKGDSAVSVEKVGELTVFSSETPTAGFLFYPGGKVEATAYAPLLRNLAERDVLCILIPMPGNLAVLKPNAAQGVAEQFPQIERWYIGGHSLGGSMAASYAAKNAETLEGLVLLAAYSTADLHSSGLRVLSLYGSENGVLNRERYGENRENLPEEALEFEIPGGNHAGFGSYGAQDGDGEATISAAHQAQLAAEIIAEFMAK